MDKKFNIDIENAKINILVIDDEEDMREFVAMCLEDFGYGVTMAVDGADAIVKLNSKDFDLVVSDIEMPKMTGLDLLKLIKKDNGLISVIMLTGVKKVTTAIEVLKLGADDYLIKPIKVEELKLSVEKSIFIKKLKEQNFNLIKENEKYQVQLEKMVEKRTEQLEDAIFSSLTIVASAIEAKDPYTRGHSNRVRLISLDIAKNLGLNEHQLNILEYGAMLHDVGKIGIRDDVLLKKGKLDSAEYEHIMSHPYVGSKIIENIKYYAPMIDCVKYHHEKFDGTGYPDNLKGEKIPLLARIIAVADTYDAMTTTRPYRKALSKEKALTILAEIKFSQLDPKLVDIFIENNLYESDYDSDQKKDIKFNKNGVKSFYKTSYDEELMDKPEQTRMYLEDIVEKLK